MSAERVDKYANLADGSGSEKQWAAVDNLRVSSWASS